MAITYNDIYIKARRRLRDAGIEAFSLEARLIVSQAAGKTMEKLMRDLNLYANNDLDEVVETMVDRRIQGEPVAYITGSWEFYGVPLEITRDALIPRTDTEVLVRAAIAMFEGRNGRPRILDLCAGSGCVGVAMGVHMPGARVVMVDNSPKALSLCRRNIHKNNLDVRVLCVEADVREKPPMLLGDFDLITCNAPYIPTGELENLDPSVKNYEPIEALDGGPDGLDIIRPVIHLWKSVLRDNGCVMLEIGEGQAEAVSQLLAQAGYENITPLQDTRGVERVMIGQKKGT